MPYVVQVEVLGSYIDTSVVYREKVMAEAALKRFRKGHPASSFRLKQIPSNPGLKPFSKKWKVF